MGKATFTPSLDAYAFYVDGTESGASIIGSQDNAISPTITSDYNIAIRLRLQENGGASGATTDGWQLRCKRNAGAYFSVGTATTYVKAYDSANLTNAGATTQRLTNGSGSFDAGVISEDGLADNYQLSKNNFTELLFTIRLVYADLVDADTLTFQIQLNGSDITFNVTPTINVTKGTAYSLTPSDTMSLADSLTSLQGS